MFCDYPKRSWRVGRVALSICLAPMAFACSEDEGEPAGEITGQSSGTPSASSSDSGPPPGLSAPAASTPVAPVVSPPNAPSSTTPSPIATPSSSGEPGDQGGAGGTVAATGGNGPGIAENGGSAGDTAGAGGSTPGGSAGADAGGSSGVGGDPSVGGSAGTPGADAGSGGAPTESPLPPIDDYSADGPFETTMEEGVGPGGEFTVYRPDPLGDDFLYAPIIFGPGIGQSVTVHNRMLSTFASHGFVVVGTPVLEGGPGDAGNRQSMLDGLDWILEQNGVAGIYEGKLDTTSAISMGFSVGGTAAVEVGAHEAVATVVSIHGHRATADLHGPMLQTTGTEDGVGMPLQQATYDGSMVPTFLATLTGAPHQYIESDGGGEERTAIVAWMRYFIYDDMGARNFFYGEDCVLCTPPWENPQRKNWE
jgi:hypothetical protein